MVSISVLYFGGPKANSYSLFFGNGKSADFAIEEGGYWRLDSEWGLHLTYEFSTFNNNTVLATVWSRY